VEGRRRLARPLALALVWVAIWEPLAPACRRGTWQAQWRGDLWHYWQWLTRTHARFAGVQLLARAATCLPHAIYLRLQEWSLPMLVHDVRFAWRQLVRRPAFTAVAVLILGLGIGANATIFSWVETILLAPLPGAGDADRLVALRGTTTDRTDLAYSYPNFVDLQSSRPDGLEDVMAFRALPMNLRAGGDPVRVWGELVTPNFFDVLRIRPAVGRGFTAADASAPEREPVAVLSHGAWQRLFAGDPAVVGRSVTLNGRVFMIVGVGPAGFRGSLAGLALDVFVPITMQKAVMAGDRLPQRGNSFLEVMGRLAGGASLARAQAGASVVAARLATAYPRTNEGRGTVVLPLWKNGASGVLMPVMATLMAVVGVVLLIACANLAGLLLARAAGRQREVAVRLAIGASRGRLVRQFLMESLLLAFAGGAAGLALSYWTAGLLSLFVPPTPFPVAFVARVSPSVVIFSIAVTLATAIVFGLVPAIRASRPEIAVTLKDAAATAAPKGRLRQTLVVAQVALSAVLLICAALFVRSLARAETIDPGFTLRQGLVASIDLLPNGYDEARGVVFFQEVLQRLSALPEVRAATLATAMPLDIGSGSDMSVRIDGYQPRDGQDPHTYYNRVGPRYFETMGIPIVRGRAIDDRDVAGKPIALVVNETMARRYWPGRDPIGSRVDFGSGPAVVIGVARDGKYSRLNEEPRSYTYIALYQYFRPDALVEVRTSGDPTRVLPAIQREIRSLDPALPLFDIRTIEEHMQLSVFIPKMAGTMLGLFGSLALLLAVVGLYSVIACTVAERTREIGIRVALGAGRAEILRLIVGQGMVLTGTGLALGLVLAAGAAQVLKSQLIGLGAGDAMSFGLTTGVLVAAALAACLIPARRAAALDPLRALRRQ
jgi:putative ABC transport system permease protein